MAETVAQEPAVAPVRPRRWVRRLVGFGAVLFVLAAVLAWFAPAIVARTGLRDVAIRNAVAGQIDGTVTVDSVSASWQSPVELRGVRVHDPAGNPVAVVDSLTTSKTLLELARDPSDLGTITVTGPSVTLVCEPAGSNLERVFAPLLRSDGKSGSTSRPAVEVRVTGGSVTVRDAEKNTEAKLENATAVAIVPASAAEAIRVTASATHESGKLEASAEIGQKSSAKLTADRFALAAVAPFVRRFGDGATVAGTLTADVAVAWGTDAAGQTEASADGRIELTDLDATAPFLGDDRVRLAKVTVPVKASLSGTVLRVEKADLTCDAGTATVAGVVDLAAPATAALTRPGQTLDAKINLARLAAIVPKLLHVQPGTAVESGNVNVALTTTADGWAGTVTTTNLHGTRDGKPIAWEKPLYAEFAGRVGADGLPVFDKLVCQADFVGLAAKGSIDRFQAKANLDLDKLSAHLAEFVDVGGFKLTGTALVELDATPKAGATAWAGTATFTRFMIRKGTGFGGEDPKLTVAVNAVTSRGKGGEVRVESATAVVAAATDELRVNLLTPIPDALAAKTATATAKLTGDLGRWRWRVNALVPLPKTWHLAGTGTLSAEIAASEASVKLTNLAADLADVKFFGAGLKVDERGVKATAAATLDPKTGIISLTDVRVSAETLGAFARTVTVSPAPKGEYSITGTAAVTANLARVQQVIGVNLDAHGTAKGNVSLDVRTDARVAFDGDLAVEKFAYGPPAKPLYAEPTLKVKAVGSYDPTADGVTLTSAKVERDGLTVDARGSVTKLTSPAMTVNVDGTLAYDLAKIEPQLKAYLGAGAAVSGKDAKPFTLSGTYGETTAVAAKVGTPKPGPYDALTGSAAVAWKSVRAYGFDVGPAELRANLAKGKVTFNPVEATFGGGKVKVSPTVDLKPDTTVLTVAPGKLVDQAKLTPAACASALGYVLPPIANAGKADGTVSFDLTESRVPLEAPEKAALKGNLTIHTATVSAGPLANEIAVLLGAKATTLTLASNQVVPVRVADGRVHHENFVLTVGDFTIRSAGSVGLDGTVTMVLDIPVPASVAQQLFPKNPRIRDALAKQSVKVPVGGTLGKPTLDAKAFRAATAKLIEDATKQAAKDALGDLFKK